VVSGTFVIKESAIDDGESCRVLELVAHTSIEDHMSNRFRIQTGVSPRDINPTKSRRGSDRDVVVRVTGLRVVTLASTADPVDTRRSCHMELPEKSFIHYQIQDGL